MKRIVWFMHQLVKYQRTQVAYKGFFEEERTLKVIAITNTLAWYIP